MLSEEFIKSLRKKADNGGMEHVPHDVDNKMILLGISELAEQVGDLGCLRPADDRRNPLVRISRLETYAKVICWSLTAVAAPVGVWAIISIAGKLAKALAETR